MFSVGFCLFVCLFVVVVVVLGVGVINLKNLMVDASNYPWPSVCGFD